METVWLIWYKENTPENPLFDQWVLLYADLSEYERDRHVKLINYGLTNPEKLKEIRVTSIQVSLASTE
jgi:hypothetical protein